MRLLQNLICIILVLFLSGTGCDRIIEKKHKEAQDNVAVKVRNLEQVTKYSECKLNAKTAKEKDDCDSLRPVGIPKQNSALGSLNECVLFDSKALESLDIDHQIKWDNIKPKISASCEHAVTLSGNVGGLPEIQDLKKKISAHYLFKDLLKDIRTSAKDSKIEESFREGYTQLAMDPKSYARFEKQIARGVEQKSVVAMALSIDHIIFQCSQTQDKICDKGLKAITALGRMKFPGIESYWANYYAVTGKTALAAKSAADYSQRGDYDFANFFADQNVNDYNKTLSVEWAKTQLANFHLRGRVSAFLQSCAETIVTAPWEYSGEFLDVSGFTPADWKAKVKDWTNAQSKEFRPILFLRFACEKLSNPKAREKAFKDYRKDSDHTFSQGFDFCSYAVDPFYSGVCN